MIQSTRGPVQIRVYGEPESFPKKDVAVVKGQMIPVDKDYRTRKDPVTGKIKKWDRGYKRRWMQLVTDTVEKYMWDHDLEPFPKNHPVAMGTLFFLTKSKSNKLIVPSQAPDEDNLDYAVKNALKRTPKKKGVDGRYPLGVLYYDDDQVVIRLQPSGKLWATESQPPGVLITVHNFMVCHRILGKYDPIENPELSFFR